MTRFLVSGDQLGQGIRGQERHVAVRDDDSAGRGRDGVVQGREATLDSSSGAGNLVLVGDDGGRADARDLGGDHLALVTHDRNQMLGVEAVSRAQSVSDHGQASEGMHNLREG